MASIQEVKQSLAELASEAQETYIAIRSGQSSDEVIVQGNKQGLIRLASLLFNLAADGIPGSHINFDMYSNTDEADLALTFVNAVAPWARMELEQTRNENL